MRPSDERATSSRNSGWPGHPLPASTRPIAGALTSSRMGLAASLLGEALRCDVTLVSALMREVGPGPPLPRGTVPCSPLQNGVSVRLIPSCCAGGLSGGASLLATLAGGGTPSHFASSLSSSGSVPSASLPPCQVWPHLVQVDLISQSRFPGRLGRVLNQKRRMDFMQHA